MINFESVKSCSTLSSIDIIVTVKIDFNVIYHIKAVLPSGGEFSQKQ